MAIQNFVAGGFYGKLGAMVGQRWKNKRTLRTWVKPKNPRTEAQQANRGRFGGCVQLAQIAMQMNWKAPCWQSESLTEWNLRMSSATMLNKSELEPFNKIPLFPYAYVAKYAIHELKVKSKDPSGKVTFSAVGELPSEDRNISVLLGYINASTGAYDMELFMSTLTTNEDDEKVFSIEIDDVSKVNNDSIYLICSNDDEEHDNESIYSNQIGAAGKITKVFDTSIIEYTRTANKHFFTFAEEYFPSETSVTNVKLYGVVAGNYETLTLPSVTLENFGGHFGFSMEQSVSDNFHIIAFASLSNIQIESISADSETVLSKAENTLNSFSSDDLTRTVKATVLDKQTLTGLFRVWIPRILTDFEWTAENIKTTAVQAGILKEWIPSSITLSTPSNAILITMQRDTTLGSMYPIFNSQSKITEGTISKVISEVTYVHDLTGLSIEDTTKETTWDNTLVSATRNKDTYTIKFREANLDLTGVTQNLYGYVTDYLQSQEVFLAEPIKRIGGALAIETRLNADEMGIFKYYFSDEAYIKLTQYEIVNEVKYTPLVKTNQNLGLTDNILYAILNKPPKCASDLDEFVQFTVDTTSLQGGSDSSSARFKFGADVADALESVGIAVGTSFDPNYPSSAYDATVLFGRVSPYDSAENTRMGVYNDESLATSGEYLWIGYDTEKVPSSTISVQNRQGKTINVQIALFENRETNPDYYWYRSTKPLTTPWEIVEMQPMGFLPVG